MLSISGKIEELIKPFKKFILDNYENPIMWFAFILIGIAIFSIVYSTLHPNE
ncbi:MAG: hypothetical protein IKF01_03630 [Bacilli bacterium]|nr:hypothetical protein [Bacilli bacterium]